MKILVTGASGFVGASLCSRLVEENFIVVGGVKRLPRKPLLGLRYCVTGDLSSHINWRDALVGVDVVVHCAARVHIMREAAADSIIAFRQINVNATINLVEQASECDVKRFVYLSSIKVNGAGTTDDPFEANDSPNPEDPYSVSKWEAEKELKIAAQEKGLEFVIIRPPLVYGPGVRANFFRLLQMVKLELPLPLGGIHNKRSLVALDNLVDLIVVCLSHPAAANQTFLVSDGDDISTATLIRKLAKAMDKQVRLVSVPTPVLLLLARLLGKSDIMRRLCGSLQVDIKKTQSILEWSPPVSIDDALRKTAMHFLDR